jgi:hypothetical protein
MRNRYSALLLIAGLIIIVWVVAHLDDKVRGTRTQAAHTQQSN